MSKLEKITDPRIKKAAESEANARWAEAFIDDTDVKIADAKAAAARVPALEASVKTLEKALARPQTLSATLQEPPKPKGQKRVDVTKAKANAATAEFKRFVKQTPVDDTLRELYPRDDHRFARNVARKMMVNPATTTSATWAAELVRSDVLGYWKAQAPTSIIGAIVDRGFAVPLEFGPNNSLVVPKRGAVDDGNATAHWVPEGDTIPVVQARMGSVALMRHKLAAISVFSNELAETSTPNIAAVIEDATMTDTSVALDQALISADSAIAGKRPAGILSATAPLTSTGIVDDLKALLHAMAKARSRRPFFVMDPATHLELLLYTELGQFVFRDEMSAGAILGVPFIVSSNLDSKLVIIDGAALFLAVSVPRIDLSGSTSIVLASADGVEPSMHDKNIHISDAADTLPPAKVVSTFQTNATAIRTVYDDIGWALVSPDAAAWLVPSW